MVTLTYDGAASGENNHVGIGDSAQLQTLIRPSVRPAVINATVPVLIQPVQDAADRDLLHDYEQRYSTLATLAEQLDIPPDEANALIPAILLAAFLEKPAGDLDSWLAGALKAAHEEQE